MKPLVRLVVFKLLRSGGILGTGKVQAEKMLLTWALDLLQMIFEVENVENWQELDFFPSCERSVLI